MIQAMRLSYLLCAHLVHRQSSVERKNFSVNVQEEILVIFSHDVKFNVLDYFTSRVSNKQLDVLLTGQRSAIVTIRSYKPVSSLSYISLFGVFIFYTKKQKKQKQKRRMQMCAMCLFPIQKYNFILLPTFS